MSDREKEGLTKLGSQGTEYNTDYDPSLLETFSNKHPETVQNLPAYVRLLVSLILQLFIFHMFPDSLWLRVSL